MSKNILLCVIGLTLGFGMGFFLANKITGSIPAAPALATANAPATDSAPPLNPDQAGAPLPPGHPDINSADAAANSNPNGVAATNADAQAAMQAADNKPKDFDLQMNAATIFYKLKAFDKAALYLQRAIDLKPRDPEALSAMGNTKYDAGDYVAAASFYERVLAVQPQNTNVQTDLGNTYFQRQPPDLRRAIEEYRKTLKIDPRHEKAMQNIAAAAAQLGDKVAAREAVQQLESINPANPALAPLRSSLEAMP